MSYFGGAGGSLRTLEIPVAIVERAHLPSLEPPRDAVKMKSVVCEGGMPVAVVGLKKKGRWRYLPATNTYCRRPTQQYTPHLSPPPHSPGTRCLSQRRRCTEREGGGGEGRVANRTSTYTSP
jgi:hypothetical protein